MFEKLIASLIYASRWLLTPIFLGLISLLVIITIELYQSLYNLASSLGHLDKHDVILTALSLIDMALVCSLLVMVAISGYETFIASNEHHGTADKPNIFMQLDPGTIKIKLALSIIAISSIHLLKVFIDITNYSPDDLMWLIIIHLTLVVSGGAVALIDRLVTQKIHK